MYVIREVLTCKPGKVRPLIDRFQTLSAAVQKTGRPPLRLLTVVPWIAAHDGPRLDEVCERFGMTRKQLAADSGLSNHLP